jgi:hypothetical protein
MISPLNSADQEWFYSDGIQQKGPISEKEIVGLIAEKAIDGESLVWNETLPRWQKLNQSSLASLLERRYAPPAEKPITLMPPVLPWEEVSPVKIRAAENSENIAKPFAPPPVRTESTPISSQNVAAPAQPAAKNRANEEQSLPAKKSKWGFYICLIPAIIVSYISIKIILSIGFDCTETSFFNPIWFEQNKIVSDPVTRYFEIIPWAFKYFSEYPFHVFLGLLAAWTWPISIFQGFVLANKWYNK